MAEDDVTPQKDRVPRAGCDKAASAAVAWPKEIKAKKPRKRLRITVRENVDYSAQDGLAQV